MIAQIPARCPICERFYALETDMTEEEIAEWEEWLADYSETGEIIKECPDCTGIPWEESRMPTRITDSISI